MAQNYKSLAFLKRKTNQKPKPLFFLLPTSPPVLDTASSLAPVTASLSRCHCVFYSSFFNLRIILNTIPVSDHPHSEKQFLHTSDLHPFPLKMSLDSIEKSLAQFSSLPLIRYAYTLARSSLSLLLLSLNSLSSLSLTKTLNP